MKADEPWGAKAGGSNAGASHAARPRSLVVRRVAPQLTMK